MFKSPSGDGLKLLFRLQERITDSSYYTQFYKWFCRSFAAQHLITGVVDLKTSDVSRCCFVSFDPEAWYRPDAQPIHAQALLPVDDLGLMQQVLIGNRDAEREQRQAQKESPEERQVIADDVLAQIKAKMGIRVGQTKAEKQYVQPDELQDIVARIQQYVEQVGAELVSQQAISYGRQLKIQARAQPAMWAELNVFVGKRGVTIVGTTKTGSHQSFTQQLVTWLKTFSEEIMYGTPTEE